MYPYPAMPPQQAPVRPSAGSGSFVVSVLLSLAFLAAIGFCFYLQAQIDDLRATSKQNAQRTEEVYAASQKVLAAAQDLKDRVEVVIGNYDTLRTRIRKLSVQVHLTGQQILNGATDLSRLTTQIAALRDRLTNEVIREWLASRNGKPGDLERVLREAVGDKGGALPGSKPKREEPPTDKEVQEDMDDLAKEAQDAIRRSREGK